MKKLFIASIILLSSCATEQHKQLNDQGVKIATQIAQKGTAPGSQIAKDNLLVHATNLQKTGIPERPLPYATENTQRLAKEVQEQVSFWNRAGGFINQFIPSGSIISGVLSPLGLGWLGSIFTVAIAVWKKKQNQVMAAVDHGKELGMAGVRAVHKIDNFIKSLKGKSIAEIEELLLKSNVIKELARDAQESEGVRPKIRKLIAEFEKSLV